MKRVWKITLYELKSGYKVVMEGEGGYAEARGSTPHKAYLMAEAKLVIQPGLMSTGVSK